MDARHQTHPQQSSPLVELFDTRTLQPLHESCGDECHAFEMYAGRNTLVQEAAYLRAQARGFEPGHELADWLAAEHEVDARLFAKIAPVGFVG
jgi:hypothetical protein